MIFRDKTVNEGIFFIHKESCRELSCRTDCTEIKKSKLHKIYRFNIIVIRRVRFQIANIGETVATRTMQVKKHSFIFQGLFGPIFKSNSTVA